MPGFQIFLPDGAAIAAEHWPRPGAPRVVFSHGAGLAVGAYRAFLIDLARGYDLIAVDLRGHGASADAAMPDTGLIDRLAADMEAIWQALRTRLGGAPMASVFHSLSGVLALLQSLEQGPRWGALALLDPAMTPPADHPLMAAKLLGTETMVRRVIARRARFDSMDSFAKFLRGRPEFKGWRDGTHADFAAATLRRDPETGQMLLCLPPAAEAQIYRENVLPELTASLHKITTPLRFICSDPDGPHASPIPTLCAAIADMFDVGFEIVPGTTHMLPLEEPEACVAAITGFLGQHGFGPAA
jgi:pimeloyl-ACP methyl ester carboxylesterase